MVERQVHRIVEQAISIAWLLGADRELDSSITTKSIVAHLFHFNLSLSLPHRTTKERYMFQTTANCSNQRDEDMKLSLSHETRERHQASKQATRSNKNQSMKEQRAAPPSLTNHSRTHTSHHHGSWVHDARQPASPPSEEAPAVLLPRSRGSAPSARSASLDTAATTLDKCACAHPRTTQLQCDWHSSLLDPRTKLECRFSRRICSVSNSNNNQRYCAPMQRPPRLERTCAGRR